MANPESKPSADAGRPATVEARIQAVSGPWLAEHHGPARLTRENVTSIAFRLIEARVRPTVEAVRQVNGGKGSPNVIHPSLRDFYFDGEFEKLWKRPTAPSDFPEPLVALWDQVLDRAREAVRSQLEQERAAVEQARASLRDQQTALAERERDLVTRIDAQEALVERLQDEGKAAGSALEHERQEHAKYIAQLEAARDKTAAAATTIERAKNAAVDLNAQLQHDLESANQHVARWEHKHGLIADELEATRGERDKARQLASEFEMANRGLLAGREAMEQHLKEVHASLQAITTSHADELAIRDREHGEAVASLRDELSLAREGSVRISCVLEERTAQLKAANGAAEAVVTERDQLRDGLDEHTRRIAELEAELREASRSKKNAK